MDKVNFYKGKFLTVENLPLHKFAKALAKEQLEKKQIIGFLRSLAVQPMHKIHFALNKVWILRQMNAITEYQAKCFGNALFDNRKLFDKRVRKEVVDYANNFSGIAKAQIGLTASYSLNVPFNIPLPCINTEEIIKQIRNKILRVVVGLIMIYQAPDLSSRIKHAIQLLLSFDFTIEYASQFAKSVAQVIEQSGTLTAKAIGLVAQGAEEESIPVKDKENVLEMLVRIFMSMFGSHSDKAMNKSILRMRYLETVPRTIKSLMDIFSYVSVAWKASVNYIKAYYFGVDVGQIELNEIEAQIPAWMSQVVVLYNDDGRTKSAQDYPMACKIKELFEQGSRYLRDLHALKANVRTLNAFMPIYNMCKEMQNETQSFCGSDKMRASPFVIHLIGESGVGKSVATNFISNDIFKALEWPYNPSRDLYVRNPIQDHWDGYQGQPLVVFDDFLQSQQVEDRVREALEIIRCNNTAPYPLKMADLASKGNTKFTSMLVILSSNANISRDIRIENITAVKRRRDLVLRVKPIPDLCTQNALDKKKMLFFLRSRNVDFSRDIYAFDILDPINDYVLAENLNYTEMMKVCLSEFVNKRNGEIRMINQLRDDEWIPPTFGSDELKKVVKPIELPVAFKTLGIPTMPRGDLNDDDVFDHLNAQGSVQRIGNITSYHSSKEEGPMNYDLNNFWELYEFENLYTIEEYMESLDLYIRKRMNKTGLKYQVNAVMNSFQKGRQYLYRFIKGMCKRRMTSSYNLYSRLTMSQMDFCEKIVSSEEGTILFRNFYMWLPHSWRCNVDESDMKAFMYMHSGIQDLFLEYCDRFYHPHLYFIKRKIENAYWTMKHVMQKPIVKQILEILALMGSLMTMYHLFQLISSNMNLSFFSKGKDTEIVDEGFASGDSVTNKVVKKGIKTVEGFASGDTTTNKVVKPKKVVEGNSETVINNEGTWYVDVDPIISEGTTDKNALEMISHVLVNALVRIKLQSPLKEGDKSYVINGIAIGGRFIMLPSHGYYFFSKFGEIQLSMTTGVSTFNMKYIKHKHTSNELDVTIIEMPISFQPMKDIRSKFCSVEELTKFPIECACMITPEVNTFTKGIKMYKMQQLLGLKLGGNIEYAIDDVDAPRVKILKSLDYKAQTKPGDCGSPVVWLHPSVRGKLLGFHVAGLESIGRGFSNIISSEFLFKYCAIKDGFVEDDEDNPLAQCQGNKFGKLPLAFCGEVEPSKQFRNPEKSSIKPSPLFDKVFKHTTEPAMLVPKDDINPLENGVLKGCVPTPHFPCESVELAAKDYKNLILSMDSNYKSKGVLTLKEAINGVPGDAWIKPLNMLTSPGFPYIAYPGRQKGKKSFILGEPGEYELTQDVYSRLIRREEKAKEGIIQQTIFCDVLKDEKRPIEKVRSGKTRIFNTAPMDLNILVRKYFLSFAAHLMSNSTRSECSVGINYHSHEWKVLWNYLNEIEGNFVAGDFSNYDKSLPPELIFECLHIINAWYDDGPVNAKVRQVLFETMFFPYHLLGRCVYRSQHGNPSGNPLTVIINSMVNSLLTRITYIDLGKRNGEEFAIRNIRENLRIANYGDDNVIKVSKYTLWYNMISISQIMEEYGMKYTPPTKGDISEMYLSVNELSYLKRKFRIDGPFVFAPLDINSIHEMINWIREGPDDFESLEANIDAAKLEMFHYGEQAYNEFSDLIDDAAARIGLHVKLRSYQYFFTLWSKGFLVVSSDSPENDLDRYII